MYDEIYWIYGRNRHVVGVWRDWVADICMYAMIWYGMAWYACTILYSSV